MVNRAPSSLMKIFPAVVFQMTSLSVSVKLQV